MAISFVCKYKVRIFKKLNEFLNASQIKVKLEELHRRWRHHQRRAALFGTSEALNDLWESV
jgi:hypothetical protein